VRSRSLLLASDPPESASSAHCRNSQLVESISKTVQIIARQAGVHIQCRGGRRVAERLLDRLPVRTGGHRQAHRFGFLPAGVGFSSGGRTGADPANCNRVPRPEPTP
jgi:hypothetical protein